MKHLISWSFILAAASLSFGDSFFAIRVSPAFHPEKSFHFSTGDGTGIVVVTTYSEGINPEEKYSVPNIVIERLQKQLVTVDNLHNRDAKGCGSEAPVVDGITVSGHYEVNGKLVEYNFRISNQSVCPKNYFLAKSAFDALDQTKLSKDLSEYIEQTELYFAFGVSIKIMEDSNYTIKILSLSIYDTATIRNAVSKRPQDKNLVLDFTNLSSIGTMFYPYLKDLGNQKKVLCLASKKSEKTIREIGINKFRVVGKK